MSERWVGQNPSDESKVASPHGELMVRVDSHTFAANTDDLAALRRWRHAEDQVLACFAAADRPPGSAGQ
jgi:hypothetical protein